MTYIIMNVDFSHSFVELFLHAWDSSIISRNPVNTCILQTSLFNKFAAYINNKRNILGGEIQRQSMTLYCMQHLIDTKRIKKKKLLYDWYLIALSRRTVIQSDSKGSSYRRLLLKRFSHDIGNVFSPCTSVFWWACLIFFLRKKAKREFFKKQQPRDGLNVIELSTPHKNWGRDNIGSQTTYSVWL